MRLPRDTVHLHLPFTLDSRLLWSSIEYLTGTKDQVAKAAKAYRVYFSKTEEHDEDEDYMLDHSIVIYLLAPNGEFLDFFTQRATVSLSFVRECRRQVFASGEYKIAAFHFFRPTCRPRDLANPKFLKKARALSRGLHRDKPLEVYAARLPFKRLHDSIRVV